MKKAILFFSFALFFQFASGQEKLLDVLPLNDEEKVLYSEVVQVDGASQEELYSRAKVWFVNTFRSANDVIQLDDKEGGQVIGKGCSLTSWGINSLVSTNVFVCYSVNIQAKEGRYRLLITDYWLRAPETQVNYAIDTPIEKWNNLSRKENAKKFLFKVDETTTAIIESLKKAMDIPAAADDW